MTRRIALITCLILVTPVVLILGYSRLLQNLANEGGKLFDDRCNNVNPALISYKNAYLEMMKLLNNKDSKPSQQLQLQIQTKLSDYISGIKAYIPLEEAWVNKQSKFVKRWDFIYLQPEFIKNLSIYQLEMYQGYLDHAKATIALMDSVGTSKASELRAVANEAGQRKVDASKRYFTAFDQATKRSDWRKLLWKSPPVNCPEENLIITDTSFDTIFPSPTPDIPTRSPNS